MSNVLITGCSSGFGFLTTKALAARGHTVVATMRDPEGRNAENAARLRAECEGAPGAVHIVALDVTDDASVAAAVAEAIERVGDLDAVVNNAGFGHGGILETFSVDELREVFEVNVFGPHRVNRAVLPHLHARKAGLIVHVSSSIGRLLFPFFGAYGPSKYALEALAETYQMELHGTGIEVTIVQPGGYLTEWFANMKRPENVERAAAYGPLAEAAAGFWADPEGTMDAEIADPQHVADGIVEVIEAPAGERPQRKVIDPMMGEAVEAINHTIAATKAKILEAMGFGG